MAAVIPEAAEAVSSGTSAVEGAGAAARARGAGGGRRELARNRPKARAANQAAEQRAARAQAGAQRAIDRQQAAQQRTAERRRQRIKGGAQRAGRGILAAGRHDRQYQPVILAEFLIAVLITAVAPVAQGGDKTAQAKGGPLPYSSDTLKQLVAIGVAYFLLALLSGSRKYGRLTAWFGGLILLAVGLNSFVTGGLAAIFGIFGPSPQVTTPDQLGQELGQMAQATQAGAALLPGAYPTPTGQPSAAQQVVAGQDSQTDISFTQPGVITTTEATAGATSTISTGTGIARPGGGPVPGGTGTPGGPRI